MAPKSLAGDALELVAEGGGFVGGEFDDEPSAAFQWYPHHDAAPLLGCFQRTVAGPGLHRRHRVLPPNEPARVSGRTDLSLLFTIRCVRCAKTRLRPPRRHVSDQRNPTVRGVVVDHSG